MNDYYDKAVKMLDEPEEPEHLDPKPDKKVKRPNKRQKCGYIIGIVAIIFLCFVVFKAYEYYDGEVKTRNEIIQEIIDLNATIDGARIDYGYRLKYFENNWTRLDIKVVFLESPWNSYTADFWYNTETQEYNIVPRDDI
jgi:hypothetical protein